MRNRRAYALLLLPLVLVLSSCIRMQQSYTIKDTENVSLELNFGIAKEYANMPGATAADMCKGNGIPAGVTPENYDDGQYVGCKVSGSFPVSAFAKFISFDQGKQIWTFKMDSTVATQSGENVAAQMVSDFQLSVTFPGKVLTHTGSPKVSGTTVTWTDPNDLFKAEGLQATAEHGTGAAGSIPWLWIIVGAGALVLIGGGVFLFSRSKKAPTQQSEQPGQVQMFGQGAMNQAYQSPPMPQPGPQFQSPPMPSEAPQFQSPPMPSEAPQFQPPPYPRPQAGQQPPGAAVGD